MNELSTEVKAKETHERAISHFNVAEQFTYKFIMDVKEIRDNRYYKELGYSNFDDYCKESWNVDRKYMSERISIAEKFNESDFVGYNRQFGHRKTLLLSRMGDTERKRAISEGIPTEQGSKPLEEATQKEIAEWKKRTEQAEQRAEQAQKSEKIALRKLEEAENRTPEIIEKEVIKEVVPEEVKTQLDSTKRLLDYTNRELKKLQNFKRDHELKKGDFDEEEAEREKKKLMWEAEKEVLTLTIRVDEFLKEIAITAFMKGAIATSSESTKEMLRQSVDELSEFVSQMKTVLRGRIEI